MINGGNMRVFDEEGNELPIHSLTIQSTNGSGTNYQISGALSSTGNLNSNQYCVPQTSTTFPSYFDNYLKPDPCALGHKFEELIEYVDGQVVAHCVTCAARAVFPRLPGGMSLLELKTLVGSSMALHEGSSAEEMTQVLASIARLNAQLKAEEDALKESRSLLEIAYKQLTKVLNSESTDEVDGD